MLVADKKIQAGRVNRPRPRMGNIESWYAKQLKGLATHVGGLVDRYEAGLEGITSLQRLLEAYAESLKPWARRVATRMIGEVDDKERSSWRALGNTISAQLHRDLRQVSMLKTFKELRDVQVELITSIPKKAAERVFHLTTKGLETGVRAAALAEQIRETTEVTKSRAILIARTETSRTASTLLGARCLAVGSKYYRWETSRDADVRAGHKAMQGKICEWANPPAVNEGDGKGGNRIMYHHPGEIWNCRCYAEPIISDPYTRERRG